MTLCGAKANGTPCWTINSSLRRSFCTRCGMRDAREVAMGVGRSLRISCFGIRLPSNKRRIIPARNSNFALSLAATRSRITDLMSSKVSEDAAELEYKIFVNIVVFGAQSDYIYIHWARNTTCELVVWRLRNRCICCDVSSARQNVRVTTSVLPCSLFITRVSCEFPSPPMEFRIGDVN